MAGQRQRGRLYLYLAYITTENVHVGHTLDPQQTWLYGPVSQAAQVGQRAFFRRQTDGHHCRRG